MAVEIVDGGFALDAETGRKHRTGLIPSGPKEGPVDRSSEKANSDLVRLARMFGSFLNSSERKSENKGRSIEDLLGEFEVSVGGAPEGFTQVVLADPDLVDEVKRGYNLLNEIPSLDGEEFLTEFPRHRGLDMDVESYESGNRDPHNAMTGEETFNPFELIRSKNLAQPSR